MITNFKFLIFISLTPSFLTGTISAYMAKNSGENASSAILVFLFIFTTTFIATTPLFFLFMYSYKKGQNVYKETLKISASPKTVFEYVLSFFELKKWRIISNSPFAEIIGKVPITLMSYGEIVSVQIHPIEVGKNSKVIISSKSKFKLVRENKGASWSHLQDIKNKLSEEFVVVIEK